MASLNQTKKRKHSREIKELAQKFRNMGKTYLEIGNQLNIAKSLIRRWCDPIANEKEKEHCREYHKTWYAKPENKKAKSVYFQNQMKKNYNHLHEIQIKSREKHKIKRKNLEKIRKINDVGYRLICQQRGYIKKILKKQNIRKFYRTHKLLGCTGKELKEYLEKQFIEDMTWENHGQFGWHVDHVQPLHVFNLNDPEQQQIAFHYTNLRPLWWKDNLSRNKGIRFENNK